MQANGDSEREPPNLAHTWLLVEVSPCLHLLVISLSITNCCTMGEGEGEKIIDYLYAFKKEKEKKKTANTLRHQGRIVKLNDKERPG